MLNRHADIKQLWYNAMVEIAAWDDKIADAQAVLDGLIGDKAAADAAAEQYTTASNQAMDAAQEIIDSNDELTEEQQNQVDELLFSGRGLSSEEQRMRWTEHPKCSTRFTDKRVQSKARTTSGMQRSTKETRRTEN